MRTRTTWKVMMTSEASMKVKMTWKWGMMTNRKIKAIVEVHTDISVNSTRKFSINWTNILQVKVFQIPISLAQVSVVVLPVALISIVVGPIVDHSSTKGISTCHVALS